MTVITKILNTIEGVNHNPFMKRAYWLGIADGVLAASIIVVVLWGVIYG